MNKKSIKIITVIIIFILVLTAFFWYIFPQPESSNKTHYKSGDAEYWADAYSWLNEQNTTNVDTSDGSKFLSWWDYNFYLSDVDGHKTVQDESNYSIQSIANFHTATSEKEAVAVWIVLLLEENCEGNNGVLSENVVSVLENYLNHSDADKIKNWIEDPTESPSYNTPIGAEYDEETSKQYSVGAVNAVYHDVTELLTNTLEDDGITWLYHDIQQATGHNIRYYGVEGNDRQMFNIFSFLADKSLLLVNGAGDDFIDLYYTGYTVDSKGNKIQDMTWTSKEIKAMSQAERSQIVVTGNTQVYKDPYFETMFYRTYIGPYKVDQNTGFKSEYDYQVPCNDMKHFYAEYISDLYVYPYYYKISKPSDLLDNLSNIPSVIEIDNVSTIIPVIPDFHFNYYNRAAVVITKYYEGAYVNGTVTFNGEPIDAQLVVLKNLTYSSSRNMSYPIEYDNTITTDGKYNLLLGAGATIQVRRNYGVNIPPIVMHNVTFDGEERSATAPISDDDAMRKGNNYERKLNIDIQPATIQGYFYTDSDDDGSYNSSVDKLLNNLNVTLYEIVSENAVQFVENNATNENGFYKFTNLLPGYYLIRAEQNGFVLRDQAVKLYENNNFYNISEMKHSAVNGKVYYEVKNNTISNANVKLTYNKMSIYGGIEEEIPVATTTTNNNGSYAFTDLLPGEYSLTVTKDNLYESVEQISLGENETKSLDISLELVR